MASSTVSRILAVLRKKMVRQTLTVVILLVTIVVFIHFFAAHPQYWQQLRQVSPLTIGVVLLFNFALLLVLAGIYRTCIELCDKQIKTRENFLLTAYSSIINFFGPLQSGPGVRALYLKTKLNIRLRDYTLATLLYYAFFACINIIFLLAGSRPWWQTILAFLAGGGCSYAVIRRFRGSDKQASTSQFAPRRKFLIALLIFTFLQILLQACVFFFELHTVNPHISFGQAISYTGAADLAIFVSLTPGAIGFRESFLVFSRSLHHISTPNILSANLIDRGTYVLFLAILFVIVLGLHAGDKLQLRSLRRRSADAADEPR